MESSHLSHEKLPVGVTRGLWDYVQSDHIADDYDEFFAYNRLFQLDAQVIDRYFRALAGKTVVDLGCGTGRSLLPLARRGLSGLGVDLSNKMLEIARAKAAEEDLPIRCVQSNLVDLGFIADGSMDYAMCLFSTLGMVHGRENRQLVLDHVHRMLNSDGLFVVHVHNYWFNLYDPGGPWWLIGNMLQAILRRDVELGDKYFAYRGIPNMFLHAFTQSELSRSLRRSGFKTREWIPLAASRQKPLRWPWLLGRLRANGWIVVCKKADAEAESKPAPR